MKKQIHVYLILILLACLSGVQGQYNLSSVAYNAAESNTTNPSSLYDQFFSINEVPVPSNLIGLPQQYDVTNDLPDNVYFSNQMQAVPFSQYQASPTYGGTNTLWIKGTQAWSQYSIVPIGANVQLLAISPSGGSGILKTVDSNGLTYSSNYFFYPNSLLSFYAASPGRYMASFIIGNVSSNPIIIDVPGTVTMTYSPAAYTNYYAPPNPADFTGPQAALDYANAYKEYQKTYGSYWNYVRYSWLSPP